MWGRMDGVSVSHGCEDPYHLPLFGLNLVHSLFVHCLAEPNLDRQKMLAWIIANFSFKPSDIAILVNSSNKLYGYHKFHMNTISISSRVYSAYRAEYLL